MSLADKSAAKGQSNRQGKLTLNSLRAVDAVASRFASQARNAWKSAQTILAGSSARSYRTRVTLIAAVTARAHGARGAGNAGLLLKLLYFRRQSAYSNVRKRSGGDHVKLVLAYFIFEVADVPNAGVVVGGAVIRAGQHTDSGDAVAEEGNES
jgi:hypothetical protein